MGLLNTIRNRFRNATEITASLSMEAWSKLLGNNAESMSGESVSPDTAMRCAAVYACVRVVAESVAQLPLPVYRRLPSGGKERVTGHPVYQLLNVRPNPWQTAFEFREMMIAHVSLRGNAYAFINRVRGNVPAELIPLAPDRVDVEQLPTMALRYWYRNNEGTRAPLPPGCVLHLRGLSSDGVMGISPITAYRESVGLAMATQRHQAKAFRNGARFRGGLQVPQGVKLTKEALERLKSDFDKMHSGDNAFKTPIFEDGMTWVSTSMTEEDAKTIETRKFTRSEIASIFRVPPHKIGDLDRATFSNIEHQALEFVTDSLVPLGKRWEGAIQRDLFTDAERPTLFAEHLFEGLLRGDTQARFTAYGLAIRDGWMNRNEVRIRENLNPEDGLNDFLLPLNMTSGNNSGDTNANTPAPGQATGQPGDANAQRR